MVVLGFFGPGFPFSISELVSGCICVARIHKPENNVKAGQIGKHFQLKFPVTLLGARRSIFLNRYRKIVALYATRLSIKFIFR